MQSFRFSAEPLPAEAEAARAAVRVFLDAELAAGHFVPHRTSWTTFDVG